MKAIVYMWVAASEDRQKVKNKIRDLRRHYGWGDFEIKETFVDHEEEEAGNNPTPMLDKALETCSKEHIDKVLLPSLRHLGKDTADILKNIDRFLDCKVDIAVKKEVFTLRYLDRDNTSITSIILSVLKACSEIEQRTGTQKQEKKEPPVRETEKTSVWKVGTKKSRKEKEAEYRHVLRLLKKQRSVRETAKLTGVSKSTVQRLKNEFGL